MKQERSGTERHLGPLGVAAASLGGDLWTRIRTGNEIAPPSYPLAGSILEITTQHCSYTIEYAAGLNGT